MCRHVGINTYECTRYTGIGTTIGRFVVCNAETCVEQEKRESTWLRDILEPVRVVIVKKKGEDVGDGGECKNKTTYRPDKGQQQSEK